VQSESVGRYQSVGKPELISRKAVSKKKKRVSFCRLMMMRKRAEGSINTGKGL